MMGKVKQLSIEKDLPDVGSMYPTRMYKMNGSYLTREEFVGKVASCLYYDEPSADIRETLDLLLSNDDMNEFVCSGGDTFFSYLSNGGERQYRQYDLDEDVVEKDVETPSRGLRRSVGIIEDPITGIEHDIVEKDMKQEEHPLKTYKVSYDILVVPSIPILQRRKTYKRSEEIVQATSFKQAKEMVRQKLKDLGKVTKSFTVELDNTEAVI